MGEESRDDPARGGGEGEVGPSPAEVALVGTGSIGTESVRGAFTRTREFWLTAGGMPGGVEALNRIVWKRPASPPTT